MNKLMKVGCYLLHLNEPRLSLSRELHLGMTIASGSLMQHLSPPFKPLLTELRKLSSLLNPHPRYLFKYFKPSRKTVISRSVSDIGKWECFFFLVITGRNLFFKLFITTFYFLL